VTGIDVLHPVFSPSRRLVRVPNRLGRGPGDVVEVRDPDRGASTEVVLGEMVPFDELKFLDTTALFTYQPVSRS